MAISREERRKKKKEKPLSKACVEIKERWKDGSISESRHYFPSEVEAQEHIDMLVFAYSGEPPNGGTHKTPRISRSQLNEMLSRLCNLPSKHLLRRTLTPEEGNEWKSRNSSARLLAQALECRFFRLDGDPLRHLLLGTKRNKLIYQVTWGTADYYESLLSLINLAWDALKPELQSKNGFHLLLCIICNFYNSGFSGSTAEKNTKSAQERELIYNAGAKWLRRNQVSLTVRESKAIAKAVSTGIDPDSLLYKVLAICDKEISRTENPILITRRNDFSRKAGLLADYYMQLDRDKRKNDGTESCR